MNSYNKVDSESHPPTLSKFQAQYRNICKTHKRLVDSGVVECSVNLDKSITVAESNSPKTTQLPLVDDSVHWGSLTDLSGFQTPVQHQQPFFGKSVTPANKRLSSTDPQFLVRIPVIDTSVSSLDSESEVFQPKTTRNWPFSPEFEPELQHDTMSLNNVEQEARDLNRLKRRLYRNMKEFTVEDITAETLNSVEPEIESIKNKKND